MNYNDINAIAWVLFLIGILFLMSWLVMSVGMDAMGEVIEKFEMIERALR